MLKGQKRIGATLVLIIVILSYTFAPPVRGQQQTPEPLSGLDQYIEKAMQEWGVPGLSVAIVKDDRVVYAKGYGTRETGKNLPVNEETLFGIGSVTKSFTAAAIGMLADSGQLKLDDPLTKSLPGLQLYDPQLTRDTTLRDILSHRSGLPRANLGLMNRFRPEETLKRLRYLKPASALRSQFHYQNQMYVVAGEVIRAVSGQSWEQFVKDRIFSPLNMKMSSTSVTALKKQENVARPHARLKGVVRAVPFRNMDNTGPAGAINSSAREMAEWLRFQLSAGAATTPGGKQLLKAATLREMQSPQTIIPLSPASEKLYGSTHFLSYGLGWFLRDYSGRKVLEHGGNVDGMTAQVGMMPEEKLGVVILANMDSTGLPVALMYRIFDAYTRGAAARDWSEEFLKLSRAGEQQMEAQRKQLEAKRATNTQPALALEKYAGVYQHDLYGEARITKENDKLSLSFGPGVEGGLEHWETNAFRITWSDPMFPDMILTFELAEGGLEVDRMRLGQVGEWKRTRQ